MCNFVRDLRAWARDLSIYLLTTGVIPRRRTAIKQRRAEFTVMGVWRSPLFPPNLYPCPLLKVQHARVLFPPEKASLFHLNSVSGPFSPLVPTRVLRGFTIRVMGSWTGHGSYDRWGFGLTPLLDSTVLPLARGHIHAHVHRRDFLLDHSLFLILSCFPLDPLANPLRYVHFSKCDGLLRCTQSIQQRHLAKLMGILVIHAAMLGLSWAWDIRD